jgi:maltodextrin utilization protein YvdJ
VHVNELMSELATVRGDFAKVSSDLSTAQLKAKKLEDQKAELIAKNQELTATEKKQAKEMSELQSLKQQVCS